LLRVHNEGAAEYGIYPYEVAKAKATQVADFAREHRHPLQAVIVRKRYAVRHLLSLITDPWCLVVVTLGVGSEPRSLVFGRRKLMISA
jgi:hypothetical protein